MLSAIRRAPSAPRIERPPPTAACGASLGGLVLVLLGGLLVLVDRRCAVAVGATDLDHGLLDLDDDLGLGVDRAVVVDLLGLDARGLGGHRRRGRRRGG